MVIGGISHDVGVLYGRGGREWAIEWIFIVSSDPDRSGVKLGGFFMTLAKRLMENISFTEFRKAF